MAVSLKWFRNRDPLMPDPAVSNNKLPAITSAPGWKSDACPAALLAFITLLVFCPVLHHRFIESWDDGTAILLNRDYNPPHLRNLVHYWTQPPGIDLFYVPITYSLWGLLAFVSRGSAPPGLPFNPAFYYAVNLISHVLSSVLVYLILRQLISRKWPAWFGAALFALHPIQVEAVAWAWTAYTPLSAMFGFFAIWQYLIFSERRVASGASETSPPVWAHYVVATLAFALALLTKPTVATIPFMIATIELGLRGRKLRDLAVPLSIWLVMAGVVTLINFNSSRTATIFVPDAMLLPMVPLDAIAFYLGKLLVPIHLVMDYGRTPYSIAGKPAIHFTCLITVALFAGTWLLRRHWPWLLVAFALFVFGLLPASGIVPFTFQHYSTVADRYVYLAMLGPALAAAFLISRFPTKYVMTIAAAILFLLGGMSVAQLRHWQDDWHLAAYTFEVNPKSMAAAGTFEYLFTTKGHSDSPDHPLPAPRMCSLSQRELLRVGDLLDEYHYYFLAAGCYRQALQKGPTTAKIYGRLGMILDRDGEPLEAKRACQQSLAIDPNEVDAKQTLEKIAKEVP
jgi:hypothetical protein